MRTWLVILYLGRSVAVVGPLDMSQEHCMEEAGTRGWVKAFLASQLLPYTEEEVTLDCVRAVWQPKIGEER